MNLMKLRIFQRQIALQCDFVMIAADSLERAIAQRDNTVAFYSIQTLLEARADKGITVPTLSAW